MKAVALMAIALMLRPSDIAPKATLFFSDTLEEKGMTFTRDMVKFGVQEMTVTFLGIKNDYSRKGFNVSIPSNKDYILDPVATVLDYLVRTEGLTSNEGVFILLNRPFQAIGASAIAKILVDVINSSGLSGLGFSTKSFRPTGATLAISKILAG